MTLILYQLDDLVGLDYVLISHKFLGVTSIMHFDEKGLSLSFQPTINSAQRERDTAYAIQIPL